MKRTANEAINPTAVVGSPLEFDTNTTEGVVKTLKAHTAAIQALANHIDGLNEPAPVKSGK